jgi:integrase
MKPTTILNDKFIKGLKTKEAKYFIHGSRPKPQHGFAICVYPNGTKSWFFIYPFEGKRCSIPLGKYPTVGLAEAGTKFEEHWKIFATGKNPATVAEDKQAELEAAPTIKALGDDYLERYAMVNKKSWEEDKRILEKEIYPAWGKRKAQDITKGNVITLLDKVVGRGSPQTANNIFKIIRKMLNWAVKKDLLKISPCISVDMPAKPNAKDRALNTAEIKTVWASLGGITPDLSITEGVKRALKLILLTAQRPGEVSGVHTDEIEGNWWTIPAARSKNGKSHRVYLSPLSQEIIAEAISEAKVAREKAEIRNAKGTNRKAILIPEDQKYSGYIFPCSRRFESEDKGRVKVPEKPIERHALSKALKYNESEDSLTTLGINTFTPHDLRRTAATFMAESGELDEVIDAVLNHAKQGVIKVYNLYRYDKEKQKALESWARKLTSITNGMQDNVIPIQMASGWN